MEIDGQAPVTGGGADAWVFTADKDGVLRPNDPRHTAVALWIAAGASPDRLRAS
jgi:hypothetical protein